MSEYLDIAVTGESPMDLSKEILEANDIDVIPFHIAFDEKDHLDGTFRNEEMFDFFDRTGKVPQSGAPSIEEYKNLFARALEKHDACLHVSMSGSLSSGYQNAVAASKEFPEGKVEVLDSRTISLGIGIIAIKAKEAIKKGVKTLSEAYDKAKSFVNKVKASLLIDRLEYMYRGGRCSKLVLLGANLLRLKPVIEVVDGKLTVGSKYRGKRAKCLRNYIEREVADCPDADKSLAVVGFTSTGDVEGETIARETLTELGFRKVIVTQCNSTNSVHGGPLVVGFGFLYGLAA